MTALQQDNGNVKPVRDSLRKNTAREIQGPPPDAITKFEVRRPEI